MTAQAEPALYVWRRNTEREPSRWVWWVIAGIMALAAFGAFAAYMADNGQIPTMIGFGVTASVLTWLIPPVFAWGRRRNPDIIMDGREMVWAKKRVSIDQVDQWSVRRQTTTTHNGTAPSSMTIGVVDFEMKGDEKNQKFTFAHLSKAEVAELIAAIDPVLPGRRID